MNMKKNWRTSLAGLLGGVVFVAPQIQACVAGQPCDWKQIAVGVAFAALGLGAKDSNVTGGTKAQ